MSQLPELQHLLHRHWPLVRGCLYAGVSHGGECVCSGIIFPINIIPSLGRGCLYVGESHGEGGGGGAWGQFSLLYPLG